MHWPVGTLVVFSFIVSFTVCFFIIEGVTYWKSLLCVTTVDRMSVSREDREKENQLKTEKVLQQEPQQTFNSFLSFYRTAGVVFSFG